MAYDVGATRVVLVRIAEDVPVVEASAGVTVQHLVGQCLMVRILDMAEDAALEIEEDDAEHIVKVLDGRLEVRHHRRNHSMLPGDAALVLQGTAFTLQSQGGVSRCEIISTPPNRQLVRHLLHLEHADHGFD